MTEEKARTLEMAKASALTYLSYGMRTEWQVRRHLSEKGYSEEAEESIRYLSELGYLDDLKYALLYLEYAVGKRHGMLRIRTELKRRGILPETNRSEPSKGIFESDTGELLMNTREKLFRAVTHRSETVSLPANRKVQLNHLAVSGSSIPATVSLHALDSQVLNRSRHMLLIYATATANSGMILSEDGATMTTPGVQPTLLRTGRLSFALDNVHAAEFALYALAMDGSRIQELPFNIRNGKCEVVINTAELRAGTVFFEFARKQK